MSSLQWFFRLLKRYDKSGKLIKNNDITGKQKEKGKED